MGREDGSWGFASGAIPPHNVRVLGIRGSEGISRLFSYELMFELLDGPLTDDDIELLFKAPCALALGSHRGDIVRGVVSSVKIHDRLREDPARYTVTVGPTASLLAQGKNSRVFQDLSVPEIVASILAQYQLMPERDYRIATRAESEKREYVVQYQESDWAFIERWLAHEGLYYWFEHTAEHDLLVIADDRTAATPIDESPIIPYRERNNLDTDEGASVFDWEVEERRPPARVVVMDYNYRTPHALPTAKAVLDGNRGFGTVIEYGEHVKSAQEAETIARVRAEAHACGRKTVRGRTNGARLHAGYMFELEGHHGSQDGRYLVTSCEYGARSTLGASAPRDTGGSFTAIPLAIQYRPARTTEWPSIHGIMHGHVATDGEGTYAQMDSLGRYKIRLCFDTASSKGAGVSRWIRMAQPYAGANEGSHHPLRKGTEVLVAFIDGDPDRPIIVSAVPNPHTISPTTGKNATQAVTRTPSGMRFEMEDRAIEDR